MHFRVESTLLKESKQSSYEPVQFLVENDDVAREVLGIFSVHFLEKLRRLYPQIGATEVLQCSHILEEIFNDKRRWNYSDDYQYYALQATKLRNNVEKFVKYNPVCARSAGIALAQYAPDVLHYRAGNFALADFDTQTAMQQLMWRNKALLDAAQDGDTELVTTLLSRGANVNVHGNVNLSPYNSAKPIQELQDVYKVSGGATDYQLLKKLLLGRELSFGATPLMLAAWSGNASTVDVLLRFGADKYSTTAVGVHILPATKATGMFPQTHADTIAHQLQHIDALNRIALRDWSGQQVPSSWINRPATIR